MTANKPMTGEQLDELMTAAANMQRDSEKSGDRPTAIFAYAVQVAVLELRKARTDFSALAAELSAVEAIHNDAVFITDDHYEQCPPEVQKIIRSLAVLQIPAYQAFLAEVRASAVDSLVDIKTKQLADMHPDTHAFGATAMSIRGQINELQMFAAQLRKGDTA